MREEKIQWHPGFFAGMELELKGYHLDFESEHQLTRGPLYIDILIIRKLTDEKIDNEIGEIFRRHYIVEYKSPNDELNIDVFYKVQAYAGLYKAAGKHVNEIPGNEITVSLVRASYPSEMMKHLVTLGAKIVERHPGVYDVQGVGLFPTQVIVTKRLTSETHSVIRVLTTNITNEDVKAFLIKTREMTNQGDKARVDAVLQVSVSANKELYRKIYKGEPEMCQALKEIMEEDFKKVESEAEKRGEKNGEKRGEKKGEKKLCDLITKLIAANRNDDIAKATSNISFRKKLYKEFQIS